MYGEVFRPDIFILDKVKKYIANRKNFAENESLVEKIHDIHEEVTKFFACAQFYQAQIYNKTYCNMEYKVGQKVWLTVKNITIEQLSQKLDLQNYGLYCIIKRIKKVAYCLNLPSTISIHNLVYVSLLFDNKPRVGEKSPEPSLLQRAIGPKVGEFELEVIFASQILSNLLNPPIKQYKVEWNKYTRLT